MIILPNRVKLIEKHFFEFSFDSKEGYDPIPNFKIFKKLSSAEQYYLASISKGIVRLYIPREESDLTFCFLFENELVTGYDSFLTQMPSKYQIETLTDILLWRISNTDLQEVYERTNNGNIIGRKMAKNLFLIKSKREISLLSKTAEERYLLNSIGCYI
jgi:CRP-like cAMP-binding protein